MESSILHVPLRKTLLILVDSIFILQWLNVTLGKHLLCYVSLDQYLLYGHVSYHSLGWLFALSFVHSLFLLASNQSHLLQKLQRRLVLIDQVFQFVQWFQATTFGYVSLFVKVVPHFPLDFVLLSPHLISLFLFPHFIKLIFSLNHDHLIFLVLLL